MGATFDQVGVLALSAGHVLLVKHADDVNWRIPRTAPRDGESSEDAFSRLTMRLGINVLEHTELGVRAVGGEMFDLHRIKIPGLPDKSDHELRMVRLSYLPKELAAPDRPLLDALLG